MALWLGLLETVVVYTMTYLAAKYVVKHAPQADGFKIGWFGGVVCMFVVHLLTKW